MSLTCDGRLTVRQLPLLLLLLLLAGTAVLRADAQPRSVSEARLARLAKEAAAESAWEAERRAQPQREAREVCSPDGECIMRGVLVSLVDGEGVISCLHCSLSSLTAGGGWADAWHGHYGPRGYALTAELVTGVPNDASSPLINAVGGAVVLLWRGAVSLSHKVGAAQDGGAVGVILVDDGSCGEVFECGEWLGGRGEGVGLAAKDAPGAWKRIRIPYVLVSASQGARLLRLLAPTTRPLQGHGLQYITT